MRPRVLLLKTGDPLPVVRARRGPFQHWFGPLLTRYDLRLAIWEAQTDERRPQGDFDAVIVTGSPSSVHHHEPWSERAAAWLADSAPHTPILGVCYGHQLLAHALGGRSGPNPRGPEYGVVQVDVQPDLLFEGFPRRMSVYQMHSDAVLELPPGARVLADNPVTSVQAFGVGDHIRAVQFHPEFDVDYLSAALGIRRERLELGHPGFTDRALEGLRDLPEQPQIIWNFLERIVGLRAQR